MPAGEHDVTMVAVDGNKTTGASTVHFIVGVQPPTTNHPPSVYIAYPSDKDSFEEPWSGTISMIAIDPDHDPISVECFVNGQSIGVVYSAPYDFPITGLPSGLYTARGIATDSNGAQAVSETVTFEVSNPPPVVNHPPSVVILSPAQGSYVAPFSGDFTALPSDSDLGDA
ncbi:MAG: Ig-like domain-containing protein, partial [Patescibacteria group bacterium]|nr:Ig-like domain-containing protein [Patescibacteria group bacterium]